jgi:hypothetical protein
MGNIARQIDKLKPPEPARKHIIPEFGTKPTHHTLPSLAVKAGFLAGQGTGRLLCIWGRIQKHVGCSTKNRIIRYEGKIRTPGPN